MAGFKITELAPSDGQTKENQVDFEIARFDCILLNILACSTAGYVMQYFGEVLQQAKTHTKNKCKPKS